MEKWRDGQDAETKKVVERLLVVEGQFELISKGQEHTKDLLEQMITMLKDTLEDTRDRLREVERRQAAQ